jgi:rhodanese-related sulfurtransferase
MKDVCIEFGVVTPGEVAERLAKTEVVLLDVRTPREYAQYRIPGAVLMPVQEIAERWQELDPQRPTICICEHGIRSETAAEFLAERDFAEVATMCGGMVRWTGSVERGCPHEGGFFAMAIPAVAVCD